MSEDSPRVLVVDDDPDVALLVKTVLERRAGCIVDVAGDGLSAVERVAAMRPDVVVTDIWAHGGAQRSRAAGRAAAHGALGSRRGDDRPCLRRIRGLRIAGAGR
ncbi:response regulator [Microbacterium maritypicum]|uniref:response regulator n=1 Tax=Microbacterium maritypicum TaxID=33918 RepID=UPI004039B135